MNPGKYQFWRALRPFSFSVALIVCLTGILCAFRDGYGSYLLASLVLIAGLLLQAGVNLINDYSDLSQPRIAENRQYNQLIRSNFRYGMLAFLIAAAIALYLIYQVGLLLLLLCVVGLFAALGYTLEPINYKRRGLAVVLVFWFMGVLMVNGSYYVLAQQHSIDVFWLSLPISLFSSLLLLSNEIRDYKLDQQHNIHTLTVRIGCKQASRLYLVGLSVPYLALFILVWSDLLPTALLVLLSAPFLYPIIRLLSDEEQIKTALPPLTGRLFMIYGMFYCAALLI